MCEIKFRGKELETNKWVYGYLLGNKSKVDNFVYIAPFDIVPLLEEKNTIIQCGYPDYDAEDYSHCWKKREGVSISVIRVDKNTIGQYTGLNDKNGKEIYEGDVVVWKDEKYIIKYLEKYTRFAGANSRCVFAVFNLSISEIVGNIYDNPELLKEE